jgi:chaperonin cofactor prefoldin
MDMRRSPADDRRDNFGSGKIMRLPNARLPDADRDANDIAARGAAALNMVRQAAEAFRAAEDRLSTTEARGEAIVQRAMKELKNLNARKETLESRLRSAEVRAQLMEARLQENEERAKQAEEWLARLHEALYHDFAGNKPAPAASR